MYVLTHHIVVYIQEAEDTSAYGPYTTNRGEFEEAKKRKRRELKRYTN